ncbi:MAG: hypothetical protein NXY57DRAFT_980313 [Lentinula lateritia]|nr:MAG: hypothetical protein NXY57DRAFT_980313 [Lentinula lateritia]
MNIDMMQPVQQVLSPSLNISSPPETLHVLSGSFRSLSLFLLAFSPAARTLSLLHQVPGFGPHQYIGTNRDKIKSSQSSETNLSTTTVGLAAYTTSWAVPPILSSWEITSDWHLNHLDNVPITAVSSYISFPHPYTHLYSMGGPTGEVHLLSPQSGSFLEKVQEILFVPPDKLADADKSRKALRYGSHAIEFAHLPGTNTRLAFVPVLGTNSIEVYTHDPDSGFLTHVYSSPSPRSGVEDGPRHVKVHPNGKILYCVTEHNNLLDVYSFRATGRSDSSTEWSNNPLKYLGTRSLLPPNLSYPSASIQTIHRFRGDTLMLGPSVGAGQWPTEIWATTRGATEDDRGWVSVFKLDQDGMFATSNPSGKSFSEEEGVERYETPTSGGKAHAIDLYPKSPSSFDIPYLEPRVGSPVWILLTDDSDYAVGEVRDGPSILSQPVKRSNPVGGVRVLEWDSWSNGGIREVVSWPSAGKWDCKAEIVDEEAGDTEQVVEQGSDEGRLMRGGSHAVWLD